MVAQNPGTQFGKTVLEHNGTVLCGNMTVAKFLAENYSEYIAYNIVSYCAMLSAALLAE